MAPPISQLSLWPPWEPSSLPASAFLDSDIVQIKELTQEQKARLGRGGLGSECLMETEVQSGRQEVLEMGNGDGCTTT